MQNSMVGISQPQIQTSLALEIPEKSNARDQYRDPTRGAEAGKSLVTVNVIQFIHRPPTAPLYHTISSSFPVQCPYDPPRKRAKRCISSRSPERALLDAVFAPCSQFGLKRKTTGLLLELKKQIQYDPYKP